MAFCKTCGNLLRPRRNEDGKIVVNCTTCTDVPETTNKYIDDEKFFNKLKNLFRSGRAEKQLKTIARSLSLTESQVHDILKALDDQGKLPYGYYDKIERLYVRTHVTDDIPDELMIDMIKQSYGYDIFGAKGLNNYISLGKNTSIRNVLQSLHGLRKKGVIRGYKKNVNWLFRLVQPNEDPSTLFFPKKEGSESSKNSGRGKKGKLSEEDSDEQLDESNKSDNELEKKEEEDDIDYDEEEEQDDSKMVYFADPEEDDN